MWCNGIFIRLGNVIRELIDKRVHYNFEEEWIELIEVVNERIEQTFIKKRYQLKWPSFEKGNIHISSNYPISNHPNINLLKNKVE